MPRNSIEPGDVEFGGNAKPQGDELLGGPTAGQGSGRPHITQSSIDQLLTEGINKYIKAVVEEFQVPDECGPYLGWMIKAIKRQTGSEGKYLELTLGGDISDEDANEIIKQLFKNQNPNYRDYPKIFRQNGQNVIVEATAFPEYAECTKAITKTRSVETPQYAQLIFLPQSARGFFAGVMTYAEKNGRNMDEVKQVSHDLLKNKGLDLNISTEEMIQFAQMANIQDVQKYMLLLQSAMR